MTELIDNPPPLPDDWTEPHPPSRLCMCPDCIPSFDERFSPREAKPERWPQSSSWALAVDNAMVSVGLDCTTADSDPQARVNLLVKHCMDIGGDIGPTTPQQGNAS